MFANSVSYQSGVFFLETFTSQKAFSVHFFNLEENFKIMNTLSNLHNVRICLKKKTHGKEGGMINKNYEWPIFSCVCRKIKLCYRKGHNIWWLKKYWTCKFSYIDCWHKHNIFCILTEICHKLTIQIYTK